MRLHDKVLMLALCGAGMACYAQPSQITLGVPPPPTVKSASATAQGVTGGTPIYYWIVVRYPAGLSAAFGPVTATNTVGIPNLSAGNRVLISWAGAPSATGYDVVRNSSPSSPFPCSSCAVVLNTSGTTFSDTGGATFAFPPSGSTFPGAYTASFTADNIDFAVPRTVLNSDLQVNTLYGSCAGCTNIPAGSVIAAGNTGDVQIKSSAGGLAAGPENCVAGAGGACSFSGTVTVGTTVLPASLPVSALTTGASPSSSATVNTAAIQAALNGFSCGGEIYFTKGTWTLNPLTIPNNGCLYVLSGANMDTVVLQAGSDAVSANALITATGSSGTRTYLQMRNLSLDGASHANMNGVYLNWANPDSAIENVKIYGFVTGIVVGNSYAFSATNVTSTANSVDGIRFGFLLDGTTSAFSLNASLINSAFNQNGRYGIKADGTRSLSIIGGNIQTNPVANLLCNLCKGVAISGVYSEATGAAPTEAQFHFTNSQGVVITGQNISNTGTTPIVLVESSDVVVVGLDVEHDSLLTGTAVSANGSTVRILGGTINNLSAGISVSSALGASSVQLTGVTFSSVTVPVTTTASSGNTLDWDNLTSGLLSASSIGAGTNYKYQYTNGLFQVSSGIGVGVAPSTSYHINSQITDATTWAPNTLLPSNRVVNTSATANSFAGWEADVTNSDASQGGCKWGTVASGSFTGDWVLACRNAGTYQEQLRVKGTGAGSTGHATCWNGSAISYCTSVVAADGTCTCH